MIPQTLKDRLKQGKVIPFIGTGVSMAVRDASGARLFSSWVQLLERAAEKLKSEGKASQSEYVAAGLKIDDRDLLAIAGYAKKHLGPCWYDLLRAQLDPLRERADEQSLALAQQIWQLGSKLIITTNYDRVLEWCCPEKDKDNCVPWNIQAIAEQAELLKNGVNRPTVWHLHGVITDATNLILTPDGYEKLYDGSSEGRYKAALQTLQSLMASHTFLFVGFSMDDPYVGVQLKGVQEIFEGTASQHYVLIRESEKLKLQGTGLPVEPVTFADFGEPFIELLKELCSISNEAAMHLPTVATPLDSDVSTVHSQEPHAAAPYDPTNRVFNVPFRPKGDQVIGRDEALRQVRLQLTEGRHTAIGHTAAFEGLGGLGKTQLAVEYAYRFRDEYPNGVIWINADQDIIAQLTEIAVSAQWIAPESEHKFKLEVALHRLKSFSHCLIIFDNVDNFADVEPYFPAPFASPHILVTSRNPQPGFTPIQLDTLDPDMSLRLLFQETRRKAENENDLQAAKEIVRTLDGLPLALELAGAYLNHRTTMSFSQYWDRLNTDPITNLSNPYLSSFTKHDADLSKTLNVEEDVLREEPLLADVLDLLTWSGPSTMGLPLMARVLERKELELTGALALGTQLKLLQKNRDEERYSLHRLVREVRRREKPLDGHEEWVDKICAGLGIWFEDLRENFLDLPRFEAEIDHLVSWLQNALEKAPLNASKLTWLQAYPAYHRGMYHEAQEHVMRALEIWKTSQLSDPKLHANLLDDLGTIFTLLGKNHQALDYKEKALAIRKEILGEHHPDIATSYDNAGRTYNDLGDHRKALMYREKALDIRRNIYGEHDYKTALSYNNVGSSYDYLGEHRKALEYKEIALEINRKALGENHPNTATSYNDIGVSYYTLGKYTIAKEYSEKALQIIREVLGESHPSTAIHYYNVGNTYEALGEHAKSLDYKKKALEVSQRTLGEWHPDTISYLMSVGLGYMQLNLNSEAMHTLRNGQNLAKKVLGRHHQTVNEFEKGIRQVAAKMSRPGFRTLPIKPKRKKR